MGTKYTTGAQLRQGYQQHIDGLVQERRNSVANAQELRIFCTNPST